MKILIRTIVIFSFFFSSAQPYLPMLEEDNQWNVVHWSFWSGGYVNVDEITISGEEEINGKIYKIVHRDGVLTNCRLREENGVVYSYESNINNEKIMLNLNLEIDDVIDEEYFCLGGGGGTIWEYKVVDIYTDFIAGADRKVIDIEGYDIFGEPFGYNEYWIEGIGSTNGLVPFGYNYDFYNLLTCFTKNGEITYFNGFTTCTPELSIEHFVSNKTVLSPNPVTNISTLQLPPEASIDLIKIYDLLGKLVKEDNINKDYYTINSMDYSSGLYFYQIFSDQKLIGIQRFIVK